MSGPSHCVVVSNYAWIERDALTDEQRAALKTSLSFTPRSFSEDGEEVKPIRLYRETDRHFGMPREFFLARRLPHHQVKFQLADGPPLPSTIVFNSQHRLAPEQEDARTAVLEALKTRLGGVVEAATGFGKTVLTTHLVADLQRPTLVIVHRGFLLKQWRRAIHKFLPDAKVGLVQKGVCDYEGKHIVLAMVQTLVRRDFPPEFTRAFGLIIFDECHRGGARSWANVMGIFRARYRLCFSATPERPDGAHVAVYHHGGPIIFSYKKLKMPPVVKRIHTSFTLPESVENGVFLNTTTLHRLLAEDKQRTAFVADIVARAVRAGRKVLVLAAWKVHLRRLEEAIMRLGWERGKRPRCFHVVGGSSEELILRAEREGQVIFGTWGYAKEALDIPTLDTLVMFTPASHIEQAIGRIAGRGAGSDGKQQPIVVDLMDGNVKKCIRMGVKRAEQYLALLGPTYNQG